MLLLSARDPADPAKGQWWEIPGGGVEGDEPTAVAAARELYEETGIDQVEMGPCVWIQHVRFDFAGFHFDQREWVHLARGDGGDYRPTGLETIEALAFEGARWWPLPELAAAAAHDGSDGAGRLRVLPPWLPERLPAVLDAGVPAQPLDLGEVPTPF